ncbi:MAG TPA: HD domain-containing protein, partial [Gammaproteobacteria bacterium]
MPTRAASTSMTPPAPLPAPADSCPLPGNDPQVAPDHDLAALFRLRNLCDLLETYLEPAQIDEVHRAYLLGVRAHRGQFRLTGEPYICHPLAVAHILAEMHMDARSVIAALLHDVIEDT